MAFNSANLRATTSIGKGPLWTYITTDNVSTAGYFSPAAAILEVGDRIFVTVLSGGNFDRSEQYIVVDEAGTVEAVTGGTPYSYNAVVLDGTNDQFNRATNLGIAAPFDTLTMAFGFRVQNLAGTPALVAATTGIGPLPLVTLNDNGSIGISSPTNGTPGPTGFGFVSGQVPAGAVVAGTDYLLHLAIRGSTNELSVWLNGVPQSPTGTFWFGTQPMAAPSEWSIGGTIAGALRLQGRLSLAWVGAGQYITDPAAFYPAKNLGFYLANPGARPQIGFGDTQKATHWNSGINQGSGGDFTATSTVTDA